MDKSKKQNEDNHSPKKTFNSTQTASFLQNEFWLESKKLISIAFFKKKRIDD